MTITLSYDLPVARTVQSSSFTAHDLKKLKHIKYFEDLFIFIIFGIFEDQLTNAQTKKK